LSLDAALTYHKELTDTHNEGSYFDMGLNNPYSRASNKGAATALLGRQRILRCLLRALVDGYLFREGHLEYEHS